MRNPKISSSNSILEKFPSHQVHFPLFQRKDLKILILLGNPEKVESFTKHNILMANRAAEKKAAKQIKNNQPNSENLKTLEYFRDLILICQVSRTPQNHSSLSIPSLIQSQYHVANTNTNTTTNTSTNTNTTMSASH